MIDSITGRIVWAAAAPGASGPTHILLCDNWLVAHFFNKNHWEVVIVELFENKRDLGVVSVLRDSWSRGSNSISAFDQADSAPWAITKRFIFKAGAISALGVTTTVEGVSPRTVLFSLRTQQILAINKDGLLSARRPSANKNALEASDDEGLPPYFP